MITLDADRLVFRFAGQFVAMPLGLECAAEEQITRVAEFGGIQIQGFPMKRAPASRS